MAASKKKRTGARAAVVVVLCLVLVCVVAAAVALGLVSRRVKSFAGGASFSLDYQITSTAAEEPALYKVLAQFGGTSGRVDGQYTPEALQLELYPQASGSSQPLTRLYISKDETLYDAGQLYRTLRSSITDNYPLAGVLIPEWNMGSYISQTQLASLLGVDDTATSLQSMNDFQLDLKKIKKEYYTITVGIPQSGRFTAWWEHDEKNNKVSIHAHQSQDERRKQIITDVDVLRTAGPFALCKIGLITGRTHQIRAHLAYLGKPVLGDIKYGNRKMNERTGTRTQALCAVRISFLDIPEENTLHYLTGKVIKLKDPQIVKQFDALDKNKEGATSWQT